MDKIGVPTVSGLKGAGIAYALGAGGGAIYGISKNALGKGLVGSIAGTLLAGSVIKGSQGEMIATILGFEAFKEMSTIPITTTQVQNTVKLI